MLRVMLFDRFDSPIGELSEDEVFAIERCETINGEHALEITTTRVLQVGWRILTQDGRGIWREHVVYGADAEHSSGSRPIGTYYCVWSLQHDLIGTRVSRMPGVQNPVAASVALRYALEGTSRWQVGTVTNTNTGGASMYDTDGWDALSTLIEEWGGELDTTISVNSIMGITSRKVDLYSKQGTQADKRRFDFGADLKSVKRKVPDGPLYCRITPRGKGEETEDGYGRKVTISTVNAGRDYLENSQMKELAKLPDGMGGWEYPTLEVENSDCETPSQLLTWAQSVLEDYTVPQISYEVDVLQLAREGVDMQGVSLGDAVQIVDRKFGGGLRISGRVVSMTVNMLDERDVKLTIGYLTEGLSGVLGSLGSRMNAISRRIDGIGSSIVSTAEYLDNIIDNLNAEINATGGYTYITEGQGLRTYNRAVSDPTVGSEASSVVEIKGGSIRIANSKTAQGAWDWKTVFVSGHVAANLVTAAQITAGYIGAASSGNYWDLDGGELRIRKGSLIVYSGSSVLFSANMTAGTVNIAGFTVIGTALYSGKTSLTSNTSGIYISTSGISVGSGTTYTALTNGHLQGGLSNNTTGYISFNNYWSATGIYGTRLAGKGDIALLTNGAFGIGSYYNFGTEATITTGQSGSVRVITSLTMTLPSGGSAHWDYKTITFTKGLMTTAL